MVLQPNFWDLQKDIEDLIAAGYFRDVLRLDVKSKTKSGVKFRFGGEESLKETDIVGYLEAQYEFKEYGATFLESWNTDNVLTTALNVEEFFEGFQWTVETVLYPDVWQKEEPSLTGPAPSGREWSFGDKTLRLQTLYRSEYGSLTFDTLFGASREPRVEIGPVFKGGVVANVFGLQLGCGISVDVGAPNVLDGILGTHFETESVILNAFMENAQVLSASLFQKLLDSNVETGVTARYSMQDSSDVEVQFACRCKLEPDTTIYFKVDNSKSFGFGVSQKIGKGVKFLVSCIVNGLHLLNGNVFSQDYHFGACLELGED